MGKVVNRNFAEIALKTKSVLVQFVHSFCTSLPILNTTVSHYTKTSSLSATSAVVAASSTPIRSAEPHKTPTTHFYLTTPTVHTARSTAGAKETIPTHTTPASHTASGTQTTQSATPASFNNSALHTVLEWPPTLFDPRMPHPKQTSPAPSMMQQWPTSNISPTPLKCHTRAPVQRCKRCVSIPGHACTTTPPERRWESIFIINIKHNDS